MLHSDIPGSKFDCNSPRLFAAYHVLLRLSMPRHPSCALSSLTTRKIKISLCLSTKLHFFAVISSRHYFFLQLSINSAKSFAVFYVNPIRIYINISQYMVGVLGFEPRTSSLSGTRSNQLSYTPGFPQKRPPFGHGPRVRSNFRPAAGRFRGVPPLYVRPCGCAVLRTSSMVFLPLNNPFRQPHLFINGGADGDRTRNL